MKTWPIRELCDPIGHYPPILFSLGDGTHIYRGRGKGPACFRGRRKQRCNVRCLPGNSLIDGPLGPVAVRDLKKGALVWSFDNAGNRVALPIKAVSSVYAGSKHKIVRVILSDGRELRASGLHPTAAERLIDVRPGDQLDGAFVVKIEEVTLDGVRTFDLLPSGPTGLYIADGVIVGSTLKP